MGTILQINVTANWGSTGVITENIGLKILSEGWKSYIAYGRKCNKSSSNLISISSNLSANIHGFQTRLWDNHGLSSNLDTRKLVDIIENLQPDIIHLHNLHGYYLNYQILFRYLAKVNIPIVWTLHDCWAFTGHCAYYTYIKCNKWQLGCGHCPNIRAYPKSYWVDKSAENYRKKMNSFLSVSNMTLVPVSNWLAGELKKSFLNKYPIQVIHNGIDTDRFVNICNISKQNACFTILGVASVWEQRKGLVDFLQLAEKLAADEQIILVGLTGKQIASLPKNIKGIPRTNNIDELIQLYSSADVFVNPTWEDNFPTTNIEALSCGTPVITYDTGGSIEAVDDTCGFVVNPGNILQLYETIQQVKQKGKDSFSSYCRARALKFDKHRCYEQYIQLYKKLLKD